jgi:hypothetical protein
MYLCAMMEADSGFLPLSFVLKNTKSLSFAYYVFSRHAKRKPAKTGMGEYSQR